MAASNYTARHLSVLEGLEAVRKRPGMYIGSTDSRGLMHCLWEIIDNSVDEALAGYGQSIQIILYRDGSVEVQDDGRGIPTDVEPRTGLSGLEVVFTKLHAGGKFGGGSYTASGGLGQKPIKCPFDMGYRACSIPGALLSLKTLLLLQMRNILRFRSWGAPSVV